MTVLPIGHDNRNNNNTLISSLIRTLVPINVRVAARLLAIAEFLVFH